MDKYNYYSKEHQRFGDNVTENAKELDKIIFIVSTGIFVLSINYVTGLKENYLFFIEGLISSWIMFSLAIFAQILSYYLVIKSSYYMQDILNKWVSDDFKPIDFSTSKVQSTDKKILSYDSLISRLNTVTLIFVFCGMICLVTFGTINLIKNNELNNKSSNQTM